MRPPTRCQACGSEGAGAFCSDCGAQRDDGEDPYLQVVDSFLKLKEIRRYLTLYAKILRSPTKKTIEAFECGGLADGIRFLAFSSGLYLLAVAVTKVPLFGDNVILQNVAQAIWQLVTLSLSYTFYYLAMRHRSGIRRTRREYILFACLTSGFTMPMVIPSIFGFWASLVTLLLVIPICVYLVRTWRYFWEASGSRVFWTLSGCTMAGSLLGLLVLVPVWMASGLPTP